jgi:hypothetical protein
MPRAAATPHSVLVRIGPIELKAGSSKDGRSFPDTVKSDSNRLSVPSPRDIARGHLSSRCCAVPNATEVLSTKG